MTFVFYDTETTGKDRLSFDQILQFAAIKTDDNLVELDRFEARCRLDAYTVPSAGAFRVTGMSIERATDPNLPTHYEMICQLRDRLAAWCPATFVGWNSMWFDEKLLRLAFYKCLHPPYFTHTHGNERSDIMKLAQCVEAFAPDVLNVPRDERGRPVYKLDRLAPANGFPHLNAHDAMGDVEATIHICRLIKERAPQAWERVLHCGSKARVLSLMEENPAFVLTDSYFGRLYQFALTRVGDEGGASSAVLAFDLSIEPAQLIGLDDVMLTARLNRRPKPLRRIKPSESPFLTPLAEGEAFDGLDYETLAARGAQIRDNVEFRERLIRLSAREDFDPSDHVEEQIYGGFPSQADTARMLRFHAAEWCDRLPIVEEFEDARYRQLGRRLIYAHCPESLPDEIRREEARFVATRLTGAGVDNPPWLTLAAADEEAAALEREDAGEHADMLHKFRAHIADLLRQAADALA
jgi:exodeoxyribonuclease-1